MINRAASDYHAGKSIPLPRGEGRGRSIRRGRGRRGVPGGRIGGRPSGGYGAGGGRQQEGVGRRRGLRAGEGLVGTITEYG